MYSPFLLPEEFWPTSSHIYIFDYCTEFHYQNSTILHHSCIIFLIKQKESANILLSADSFYILLYNSFFDSSFSLLCHCQRTPLVMKHSEHQNNILLISNFKAISIIFIYFCSLYQFSISLFSLLFISSCCHNQKKLDKKLNN